MLEIIDSYLLNKDVSSWYDSLEEEYQEYYNPVFDIRITLEYIEEDFLISVLRANSCVVAVYTYELYSIKTDKEILDHILKIVWEIINDK